MVGILTHTSDLAPLFIELVKSDLDLVIGMCAPEGGGKSTCAIDLAMKLDPAFTLDRNMIYSPDHKEVQKRIHDLPKYTPIILDEAIKILLKDEHYSKMQIFLKKVFATARKKNKIIILCMPYFSDFSVYWRKNRIKIWLQIIERGVGAAFVRDNFNIFSSDPWHMRANEKLLEEYSSKKRLGDITFSDKNYIYSKSTNFWKMFEYDNIPESIAKEYKEKSEKVSGELEMEEEKGDKKEAWKSRYALLARANIEAAMMSVTEIAGVSGTDHSTVSKVISEYVGKSPSQVISENRTHRIRNKNTVFSKFLKKSVDPNEIMPKKEDGETEE